LKKAETFEIDRYDSNEFVFAVGGWPIAAPLCARDYAASAEGKLGLRIEWPIGSTRRGGEFRLAFARLLLEMRSNPRNPHGRVPSAWTPHLSFRPV